MAARVRHWSARDLTLLGRVYVAKQLMASTITHLASFIPPPPTQLKARWCANDVLASVGHPPGGQPTVRLRLLAPTPSDLA